MLNELQFCSHKAATHMPSASTVSMKNMTQQWMSPANGFDQGIN